VKKIMLLLLCALAVFAIAIAEGEEGPCKSGSKNEGGEKHPGGEGTSEFLQNKFEKLDADGSGTISKEEFPWSEEKFAKFDADGDGELSLEEFKKAVHAKHHRKSKEGEKGAGSGEESGTAE